MNALTISTAIYSGRVQLVTVRQRSLTVARMRVLLVAGLFAALAAAAVMRIAYLGLSDADHASSDHQRQHHRWREVLGLRHHI